MIMTIVLKRKINYHLLQTYLPSGKRPINANAKYTCWFIFPLSSILFIVYSQNYKVTAKVCKIIQNFQSQTIWKCCIVDFMGSFGVV